MAETKANMSEGKFFNSEELRAKAKKHAKKFYTEYDGNIDAVISDVKDFQHIKDNLEDNIAAKMKLEMKIFDAAACVDIAQFSEDDKKKFIAETGVDLSKSFPKRADGGELTDEEEYVYFMYRDGDNYKFYFALPYNEVVESLKLKLKPEVEQAIRSGKSHVTTYEKLGYTKAQFFNDIIERKFNKDVDHDVVEVIGFGKYEDMPSNYADGGEVKDSFTDLSYVNPSKITTEETSAFGNPDKLKVMYNGKKIAQFYFNMRGYNQDFFLRNKEGVHYGFGGDRSKTEQIREFKKAIKDGFTLIKNYPMEAGGKIGKMCEHGLRIQTLIFDKEHFTKAKVKSWLKRNDFKYGAIETEANTFRARQEEPSEFSDGSFRTSNFGGKLPKGIQAVTGCPIHKKEEGGELAGAIKELAEPNTLIDTTAKVEMAGGGAVAEDASKNIRIATMHCLESGLTNAVKRSGDIEVEMTADGDKFLRLDFYIYEDGLLGEKKHKYATYNDDEIVKESYFKGYETGKYKSLIDQTEAVLTKMGIHIANKLETGGDVFSDEIIFTTDDNIAAHKDGWAVSYAGAKDGVPHYELIKVGDKFLSFAGVVKHVVEKAKEGSKLHEKALAFIKAKDTVEWNLIVELSDKNKEFLDSLSAEKFAAGGKVRKKAYTLGDMWSSDFDYDGMLKKGVELGSETPPYGSWYVEKLEKLFDSFQDVNYHTEARPLWAAINILKGDISKANANQEEFLLSEAEAKLKEFVAGCKATLKRMGYHESGGKVNDKTKPWFFGSTLNEKFYQAMQIDADKDKQWAEKKVKEVGREWKEASEVSREMLNEYLDKSVEELAREKYNYLRYRAFATDKRGEPIDPAAKERWEKITGETIIPYADGGSVAGKYKFTDTPSMKGVIVEPILYTELLRDKLIFLPNPTTDSILRKTAEYVGYGWIQIDGENGSKILYTEHSGVPEAVILDHKQGGRMGIVVVDFIRNNPRPEADFISKLGGDDYAEGGKVAIAGMENYSDQGAYGAIKNTVNHFTRSGKFRSEGHFSLEGFIDDKDWWKLKFNGGENIYVLITSFEDGQLMASYYDSLDGIDKAASKINAPSTYGEVDDISGFYNEVLWQCEKIAKPVSGKHGWFAKGGDVSVYGTDAEVEKMYLDYVNNFLTVDAFAEHYNISKEKAERIIELGREINGRLANGVVSNEFKKHKNHAEGGGDAVIGTTQSGKKVYSNKMADHEDYRDFTAKDHEDAGLLHNDRRVNYKLTESAENKAMDIQHSHVEAARYAAAAHLKDLLMKYDASQSPLPFHVWVGGSIDFDTILNKTTFSDGLKKDLINDFKKSGHSDFSKLIGVSTYRTRGNIENSLPGFSSGKYTDLQAEAIANAIHSTQYANGGNITGESIIPYEEGGNVGNLVAEGGDISSKGGGSSSFDKPDFTNTVVDNYGKQDQWHPGEFANRGNTIFAAGGKAAEFSNTDDLVDVVDILDEWEAYCKRKGEDDDDFDEFDAWIDREYPDVDGKIKNKAVKEFTRTHKEPVYAEGGVASTDWKRLFANPQRFMKYNGQFLYPPRIEHKLQPASLDKLDTGEYIAEPKFNGSSTSVSISENNAVAKERHNTFFAIPPKFDFKSLHRGEGYMCLTGEFMNKSKKDHTGQPFRGFVIWDILAYDGLMLIGSTPTERIALLEELYPSMGAISVDGIDYAYKTGVPDIYRVATFTGKFTETYNILKNVDMIEGLCLKRESKLEAGSRELNNTSMGCKVRKPERNYIF